jgi:hypothetical protein
MLLEQSRTFLHEILRYVRATETEQQRALDGHLPTIDEYMQCRKSTSAVGFCLALIEFCYRIELPRYVLEDPDMLKIWDAVNIIISLINDTLSFKKEIAQDQIDSVVPLLYLEHGSLDTAMKVVEKWTTQAVKDVDEAAASILRRYSADSALQANIQKMIDGCKYACTAKLSWRQVDFVLLEISS